MAAIWCLPNGIVGIANAVAVSLAPGRFYGQQSVDYNNLYES